MTPPAADIFTYLQSASWWNVGANVIQWTTIVGWAFVAWGVWSHRCGAAWCVRAGHVPVKGTAWKTCRKHSTAVHHDALRSRHVDRHPDRLGHE